MAQRARGRKNTEKIHENNNSRHCAWRYALCALRCCLSAAATGKVPRIGVLSGIGGPNHPGLQVEAFRQGLRELGYIEGKNIMIEYRYVEAKVDRVPNLVAELMQLKIDVFLCEGIR